MAFRVTDQDPTLVNVVGSYANLAYGMIVMASGAATETVRVLHAVDGFVGCVQGATGVGEIVITVDITGNAVQIETVDECGCAAGTSVVMWIAWGPARY